MHRVNRYRLAGSGVESLYCRLLFYHQKAKQNGKIWEIEVEMSSYGLDYRDQWNEAMKQSLFYANGKMFILGIRRFKIAVS